VHEISVAEPAKNVGVKGVSQFASRRVIMSQLRCNNTNCSAETGQRPLTGAATEPVSVLIQSNSCLRDLLGTVLNSNARDFITCCCCVYTLDRLRRLSL